MILGIYHMYLPMPCLSISVIRSASVNKDGGEVSPWTISMEVGWNLEPGWNSGKIWKQLIYKITSGVSGETKEILFVEKHT